MYVIPPEWRILNQLILENFDFIFSHKLWIFIKPAPKTSHKRKIPKPIIIGHIIIGDILNLPHIYTIIIIGNEIIPNTRIYPPQNHKNTLTIARIIKNANNYITLPSMFIIIHITKNKIFTK